ncbi:MAG: imidazoleglycerol-phosphate dehydratase HisB [Desulfobacterales bacterium]
MTRSSEATRTTQETRIHLTLDLDGSGSVDITTGIPFFDHMLTLFAVHGFLDLTVAASGDLEVDHHHTVEDVGLVLGDVFRQALGDRSGIKRYGHAVTPMDEALTSVSVDLSNRPFMVFHPAGLTGSGVRFDIALAKEFFRAFANRCGMNLHINVHYGENPHHVIESIFKAAGRALDEATAFDGRITGVRSTKGAL